VVNSRTGRRRDGKVKGKGKRGVMERRERGKGRKKRR
jgi:hypothetical protein